VKFLKVCAVFVSLFIAAALSAADVTIFAAASLFDALTEIARVYEAQSGDKLRFNFGASSALARQIKAGATADVFFSADEAQMDDLAKAGLIAADTRVSLLANTLVIVVHADGGAKINTPADLASASVRRLALAEPHTVPAGIYAKEFLQKAGLWEKVIDKVVPTENVRACLAAVESGNVHAGIVYKTDALISKKVRIAHEVSAAAGPKIFYPLAMVKDAKDAGAARRGATFLASAEARGIFERYGFLPAAK
jgi:molybdate transport system substrate-binding protein